MAGKNERTGEPDRTFKTALLWWKKGQDNSAVQREIADLLGKPLESRVFDVLPQPRAMAALQSRVCWIRSADKLRPHFLFYPRLNTYNVEEAYERARAANDGRYSPHTAFRSLNGDHAAAVRFVNEFGPLEFLDEAQPRHQIELEYTVDFGEIDVNDLHTTPTPRSVCVWVDLWDLWEKRRRFVSVVKLWEARADHVTTLTALSDLAALRVWPPIGAWRHGQSISPVSAFPWRDGAFHLWCRSANAKRVMATAAEIIKAELNLQCFEMRTRWTCFDRSRLQFRLAPAARTLWTAIWHLFARDTGDGLGWRICPHCSKLFYPKRKDSYFCEPRYQKLHDANRWWNEHAEEELEKRRKKRATTKPAHKQALAKKPEWKGR
jgi:hypothetical protein